VLYRQAIALQPDFVEAHYNLGLVLQAQGEREEAIACYQKALEIQPNCVEAKVNLNMTLSA
jgi:protein O-GlcNAc transferase